jgi:hypothetical protein
MDPTACNVIYVDQRVKDDRQVRRNSVAPPVPTISDQQDDLSSYLERVTEDAEVSKNIQVLLSVFSHGARNSLSPNSASIPVPHPSPVEPSAQAFLSRKERSGPSHES